MFGFKAKTIRLCERMGLVRSVQSSAARRSIESSAMIAHAIYLREQEGRTTTLRQLHRISEISQHEALRIVADLESAGMVSVARDLHDALESQIDLTDRMRNRMASVAQKDAA